MATSSGKPLLVVIHRSKLPAGDEGRRVCAEFKQAKYPFKWRKYMCAKCGALREEHNASKSKLSVGDVREHNTDNNKLSAGDEGEHGADKCKLSTEDESKLSAEDESKHNIYKSKLSARDEGQRVCTEFKQAKYPFKWRKYMCARCRVLRSEHGIGKAKVKADDGAENIREEHLPPRKRLILRFKRSQALAAATAAATAREKEEKEGEVEEGEITWSPGMMVTKGKRAPKKKRVDAP